MNKTCYCGADNAFSDCCEPIILQQQLAASAEQLMRSRFSAFYTKNEAWLKLSWDESTRPSSIQFEDDLKWLDLTIINTDDLDEAHSSVEFEARYFKAGKVNAIHENSHFIKQGLKWLYSDGDYLKTTFKAFKIGRNDHCPCHSGRKYKSCCGRTI